MPLAVAGTAWLPAAVPAVWEPCPPRSRGEAYSPVAAGSLSFSQALPKYLALTSF